jgi:hypothetical protein
MDCNSAGSDMRRSSSRSRASFRASAGLPIEAPTTLQLRDPLGTGFDSPVDREIGTPVYIDDEPEHGAQPDERRSRSRSLVALLPSSLAVPFWFDQDYNMWGKSENAPQRVGFIGS